LSASGIGPATGGAPLFTGAGLPSALSSTDFLPAVAGDELLLAYSAPDSDAPGLVLYSSSGLISASGVPLPSTAGTSFNLLAIADLDADGRQDVVAALAGPDGSTDALFLRQTTAAGSQQLEFAEPEGIVLNRGVAALALQDGNGDGQFDLHAAAEEGAVFSQLAGLPDGSGFAGARASTIPGDVVDQVRVADWDLDGLDDVVARNSATGQVYLALGQPQGGVDTFTPLLQSTPGGVFEVVDILDFGGIEIVRAGPGIGLGLESLEVFHSLPTFVGLVSDSFSTGYIGQVEQIVFADFFESAPGEPERLDFAVVSYDEVFGQLLLTLFENRVDPISPSIWPVVGSQCSILLEEPVEEIAIYLEEALGESVVAHVVYQVDGVGQRFTCSGVESGGPSLLPSVTLPGFDAKAGFLPNVDLGLDGLANNIFTGSAFVQSDGIDFSMEPIATDLTGELLRFGQLNAGSLADVVVLLPNGRVRAALGVAGTVGEPFGLGIEDESFEPVPSELGVRVELGDRVVDFDIGDIDGDGTDDIVAVDQDGVVLVSSRQP
ncbi:MAG: hypothetical protein AAFZ65_08265, partial [Planctomycetota bacterium]